MSVDGIILRLLIWLVNYVAMLLVICQLSRDVIGYEDSQSVTSVTVNNNSPIQDYVHQDDQTQPALEWLLASNLSHYIYCHKINFQI